MSRYIEESEAIMVLSDYYHHRTQVQHKALQDAFSRVPTADVVEVVRCKDCVYWDKSFGVKMEGKPIHYKCGNFLIATKPDFYCAWGERRK